MRRDTKTEAAWCGPPVHEVDGRFVQGAVLGSMTTEARSSELEPSQSFACNDDTHAKLKANRRCLGCGRTRNEIELEEG